MAMLHHIFQGYAAVNLCDPLLVQLLDDGHVELDHVDPHTVQSC